MQIIVIFGYPGVGKTYVGKTLEKEFGFYFYDADQALPTRMKTALENEAEINDEMRDEFFNNIITTVYDLKNKYQKIAVAQTFIKIKYREQFSQEFPEAKFVLVQADERIRERRLFQRKDFPISPKYAKKMVNNFDAPFNLFATINNNPDGGEDIKKQLQRLFI